MRLSETLVLSLFQSHQLYSCSIFALYLLYIWFYIWFFFDSGQDKTHYLPTTCSPRAHDSFVTPHIFPAFGVQKMTDTILIILFNINLGGAIIVALKLQYQIQKNRKSPFLLSKLAFQDFKFRPPVLCTTLLCSIVGSWNRKSISLTFES